MSQARELWSSHLSIRLGNSVTLFPMGKYYIRFIFMNFAYYGIIIIFHTS